MSFLLLFAALVLGHLLSCNLQDRVAVSRSRVSEPRRSCEVAKLSPPLKTACFNSRKDYLSNPLRQMASLFCSGAQRIFITLTNTLKISCPRRMSEHKLCIQSKLCSMQEMLHKTGNCKWPFLFFSRNNKPLPQKKGWSSLYIFALHNLWQTSDSVWTAKHKR